MGLFEFKFNVEVDNFSDASFWMNGATEAIGTALWLSIAAAASVGDVASGWAFGISAAVLAGAFSGHNLNTLNNMNNFLNGEEDIGKFVFSFIFHSLGAILCPFLTNVGLTKDSFSASAAFPSDLASAKSFFFGAEAIALALFIIFSAKSSGDLPAAASSILNIYIAFSIGGAGFGFIPARSFNSFAAFANVGSWALFVQQFWGVLLGNLVNKYVINN